MIAPPNWRQNRKTWDDLFTRLKWCYGDERAVEIMDGKDAAANADLASWQRLCDRANRPPS